MFQMTAQVVALAAGILSSTPPEAVFVNAHEFDTMQECRDFLGAAPVLKKQLEFFIRAGLSDPETKSLKIKWACRAAPAPKGEEL